MAKSKEKKEEQRAENPIQETVNPVLKALASDAKRQYVNGFYVYFAAEDALLVLYQNGEPVSIVNMPHSVAKSLSKILGELVIDFEKVTGKAMPNIEDIRKKFFDQ